MGLASHPPSRILAPRTEDLVKGYWEPQRLLKALGLELRGFVPFAFRD